MGKYKNKFKVGDCVVCNANYSWIRRGTTYQVKAVNRTGSIQLHGSSGNYNPDKFYLASEDASTKLIIKGFSVGDRVTWAQGNSSYEIDEFSNDRKRARMKPGSGLFINKYNSVNTSEQADAHDGDWIDIKHLQVVDSFEEYYTTDHENTKEPLYIAICVDGRYPDINTFITDCKKDFIPVKLTNSTKFRIGTKSELEENLKKDFENDPTFGKYPTSQQWIFALLDSAMELSTQLSPVVVSKTKDF